MPDTARPTSRARIASALIQLTATESGRRDGTPGLAERWQQEWGQRGETLGRRLELIDNLLTTQSETGDAEQPDADSSGMIVQRHEPEATPRAPNKQ